ncbi:MAG: glycosyltransferase family 39 protein [Chloroflexi bacterium]|nr:glycosyltransferase family 39 protein [Chloroflexota bacterium]
MWYDEWWSIYLTGSSPLYGPISPADTLARVAEPQEELTPPGYYLALNLWSGLAGETPFALRLWSVVCALLTIAIAYRAGRSLGSPAAGIGAAVLLGGSALFIRYTYEARAYMQMLLICAVFVWSYLRLIAPRPPSRPVYAIFALSLAGLLYTHYLTVPLIGAAALYHLLYAPKNRRWLVVGLVGLAGGALFLPWAAVAVKAFAYAADDPLPRLLGARCPRHFDAAGQLVQRWQRRAAGRLRLVRLGAPAGPVVSARRRLSAPGTAQCTVPRRDRCALPVRSADPVDIGRRAGQRPRARPGRPAHRLGSVRRVGDPQSAGAHCRTVAAVSALGSGGCSAWGSVAAGRYADLHPARSRSQLDSPAGWRILSAPARPAPGIPGVASGAHAGGGRPAHCRHARRPPGASGWPPIPRSHPIRRGDAARDQALAGEFVQWGLISLRERSVWSCTRAAAGSGTRRGARFTPDGGGPIALDLVVPATEPLDPPMSMLFWTEPGPDTPSDTYSVGIHVEDAAGTLVASLDYGVHAGSACQIVLLPDLPAGSYTLYGLIYAWQTGERLPGEDLTDGMAGDRLPLLKFEIASPG